jgi:hypothetical protein
LDYDGGTTSYALVVEYSDGTNTVEVPVDVTVGAVNENTPAFGANVDVTFAEDTAVGTLLATHVATDADASPHNIQAYAITSGLYHIFRIYFMYLNSLETFYVRQVIVYEHIINCLTEILLTFE